MTQRRRVKLTAMQRTAMWSRWKAGQSLQEIGRAFGKDHVSIQFMLSQHGGIVPATRRRSLFTLTLAEREDILDVAMQRQTAGTDMLALSQTFLDHPPAPAASLAGASSIHFHHHDASSFSLASQGCQKAAPDGIAQTQFLERPFLNHDPRRFTFGRKIRDID